MQKVRRIWSLSISLFIIFDTSESGFLRLLSEVILSLHSKVATWVNFIPQGSNLGYYYRPRLRLSCKRSKGMGMVLVGVFNSLLYSTFT